MTHALLRTTVITLALVAASSLLDATTSTATAQQPIGVHGQNHYGNPDLFYNYYSLPGYEGVSAQMYLAPVPVPASVGHTYYTYQPFMPHEMLYKHSRTYHRYSHDGRGFTRTHIRWW